MQKFALKIAYDGSAFCGWQVQPNGITVQQCIEDALKVLCKQKIKITGSGRTDSSVHALAQYASVDIPINISAEKLKIALTTKLPDTIKIVKAYRVKNDFNARFSAINRGYVFKVSKNKTPFNRLYKTHFLRKEIDSDYMQKALKVFAGEHDFTEFCKQNPDLEHNRCIINNINWLENENGYEMHINANRFLHNMVRRILGTTVNCCHQKLDISYIQNLLNCNSTDRRFVYTAPPNGLYLNQVSYPKNLFID